jgi:hypothetical protein
MALGAFSRDIKADGIYAGITPNTPCPMSWPGKFRGPQSKSPSEFVFGPAQTNAIQVH